MKLKKLVELVSNEISLESISNFISRLSQYHRIQGSVEYFEASKYIQAILDKNGIENTLYEYIANGKWEHWGWVAPISWNIEGGECWITKPIQKRLCRFQDNPMSVITHSNAADFEAVLVDVGVGDNFDDYKNASNKIAMITASPRQIFQLAAKQKVKGLMLHPNEERAANIGDMTVQYDGFWPVAESFSDVTSGFSISHQQARELKKLLKNHDEVKIHFRINANFSLEDGKLHVLEARLDGSEHPSEEIVVISHLCHPAPSANDNASGSATLLEIALVLIRLMKSGKIENPKRTIKFLWVPEFSGTIPWLKEYETEQTKLGRKILAVFNLDMVGESQSKIGTPLKISNPSFTTPSYLQAILKAAADYQTNQKVEKTRNNRYYRLNYTFAPFTGGSDHLIFNDTYFSIPSVMLGHDDPYHHSSADSFEKVDPLECRSVGSIVGSVSYWISQLKALDVREGLSYTFQEGIQQIIKYELQLDQINDITLEQKCKQSELLEKIILNRLKSLLVYTADKQDFDDLNYFSMIIMDYFSRIRKNLKNNSYRTDQNESEKNLIFKRNYKGPISYKRLMILNQPDNIKKKMQEIVKFHWGGIALEFLNLIDAKLTLEEVFLLLQIEYPQVTWEKTMFLAEIFQEEGILTELTKS